MSRNEIAVAVLGALVLILAVGMPVWLTSLEPVVAATFGTPAAAMMHDGWLLVPLSEVRLHFAEQAGHRHAAAGAERRTLTWRVPASSGTNKLDVWYPGRDASPSLRAPGGPASAETRAFPVRS